MINERKTKEKKKKIYRFYVIRYPKNEMKNTILNFPKPSYSTIICTTIISLTCYKYRYIFTNQFF